MLVVGITLTLPVVQTKIAQYVTSNLNKDFGTKISIEKISISIFGGVKLKKVLILDHHKDTLIYVNRIKTDISDAKKLMAGDLIFGELLLDGVLFNLKTYKKEKLTNLDVFVNAFGKSKPSKKHFLLIAKENHITNGHFILTDENHLVAKDVDFSKIKIYFTDFKLYGTNINTTIHKMSFLDHRGVFVVNLKTIFSYTIEQMKLKNLDLETKESRVKAQVAMNYKIKDFSDFLNKVKFDVNLESAKLATNDIRFFYNELGKNLSFKVKAKISGPLNNLDVYQLRLFDKNNSQIIGNLNFKNLFPNKEQQFSMDGKFSKLVSSYDNLVKLLPNVLGKTLPISLKKLGLVRVKGNSKLTSSSIKGVFEVQTALGNIKSDLVINDFNSAIQANYTGKIILDQFDLGSFLEVKDLKKVSLDIDVDGQGFQEKYLNTAVKGSVSKMDYNGYGYSNISLNGIFKKPLYSGQFSVNDPNLVLDFDGLIDLSKADSSFDFKLQVANADLHQLNFVTDSISKFKGDVAVQVTGNTLENLQGNVFINKTSYQNVKGIYDFNDFTINSNFDANKIRTITVNSPDIVEGQLIGKYQFSELKNLMTNSLGSLYTNYKPLKVNKGQFLKFDFTVYNKIIEIFYPDISIASNTFIKGNINSDTNEFRFKFNSPKIVASQITFDNINVAVDNKNPLYNAYIQLDSIKSKQYKIRDFSLINVTMKDTLFFRSEFKGGDKGEDYFNLNLFHTINDANKNVIGINKSEVKFKDYLWFLNENETEDNQIVFDKALKNFNFNSIILSHENQSITLLGDVKDLEHKDLKLKFKDVDLNKITPTNDKFIFDGNINGEINYKQDKHIYQPTATLVIDHLNLNKTELGVLNFNIEGDENFKKFTIKSGIEKEGLESFTADGSLDIVNEETVFDLNLKLNKFNLGVLSSLGGDVISNIRGVVSGNATIGGNLKKPDINGRLYIDNAGLKIPYLNVDYLLGNNTIVDLTAEKFIFRNNTLTDKKYGTTGILSGNVQHTNFSDWKLDLAISSKRLVALDTKDSEEAAYFGTAFINGEATIKGPTNALFIKVAAKSEKGTSVKIPINNSTSSSTSDFIHFLSAKEKFNIGKGIFDTTRKYKGLELEFDFDINQNAEVEVILDRNTGHGMKGKGFGSLLLKINTLGKFNMWGDFQAYEGTYNFKYGGLIDKKFDVKKGGTITWEGDPMKAQLNLEAVYKTSANPAVLLENPSFKTKVPVEVRIGLHGDLASPEPDFNIEFPTVSSVLKSEIQYKLNDKDVRQTQALYLLSSGGFLSAEGVSQTDFSGSIVETATNLIGGIIQSKDDKFKVGLNLIGADKRIGRETDGRFVATVSSKVNERITINGKVGVPFGGISQTAIVGDVEMLYRVNTDGSLNLRLFNKENDINYIGQGIGYTQGFGISYEVDFNSFSEFVNKIFKNAKLINTTKNTSFDQDSNLAPEFINFSKSKKPNIEAPKANQEGLVPDEY